MLWAPLRDTSWLSLGFVRGHALSPSSLVKDRFRPGAVVAKPKPTVGLVELYLGSDPDGAMPPGQWRYLLVGEKFWAARVFRHWIHAIAATKKTLHR